MKLFRPNNSVSIFYIVLFFFVSSEVYCQQNSITPKVRERINFDFNWKFQKGEIKAAEKVDFNDKDWRSLNVPHDWSIEGKFEK